MIDYNLFTKVERAAAKTKAPIAAVWAEVESIGGARGWYYLDFLWQLRGKMDQWVGGCGMRRRAGRRESLKIGDPLDFYRVIDLVPEQRLSLLVEFKLPGDGLFEFTLSPLPSGETLIDVAGYYKPRGIAGLAYWYGLMPLHRRVFKGLCSAIVKQAESASALQHTHQP